MVEDGDADRGSRIWRGGAGHGSGERGRQWHVWQAWVRSFECCPAPEWNGAGKGSRMQVSDAEDADGQDVLTRAAVVKCREIWDLGRCEGRKRRLAMRETGWGEINVEAARREW